MHDLHGSAPDFSIKSTDTTHRVTGRIRNIQVHKISTHLITNFLIGSTLEGFVGTKWGPELRRVKGIAIDLRGTDSSVFQYKVPAAEFDEFPESPYARIVDRCSTRGAQQTPGRPTHLLAACSAPWVLVHAVSQAAHVAGAPRTFGDSLTNIPIDGDFHSRGQSNLD